MKILLKTFREFSLSATAFALICVKLFLQQT